MNAYNWKKIAAYCISAAMVGAVTRFTHLRSAHEAVTLSSLIVPTLTTAATMFFGIVTDATKPVKV